jgi:3-phenylpropionate/trans-cinnamate dioxygenase ferredoxin reductase subunit
MSAWRPRPRPAPWARHATIIEREPRVLARVACETLSLFFQDYHGARGVTFELNAGVAGFEGEDGHVTGVRFADGSVVACDAALVGVGAVPNDELAKDAGLDRVNGVVVDLEARTGDPVRLRDRRRHPPAAAAL